MRQVNPAAQALREIGRAKIVSLLWIRCRNRETGAVAPIGIWSASDAENVMVADIFTGDLRDLTFYPGLLAVGEVTHETGIIIRPTQVTLSPLDTSVQIAFRERDARGAQVQIWRRTYDVDTQRPVSGLPEAWFSGFVNEAPISTDVGSASLAIDIVSTARVLTIASARKKSDQAQRLRSGDRFRRYKATAGEIDLAWAQEDRE